MLRVVCAALCWASVAATVPLGASAAGGRSEWRVCRSAPREAGGCLPWPTPTTTAAPPTTSITTTTTNPPTTTPFPTRAPRPVPDHDEIDKDSEDLFKETSEQIINIDKNVVELCLRHRGVQVRELYESAGYRLVYRLPDLLTDTIAVSLRHRVLRVRAERIMGPRNFSHVAILPEIVDVAHAQWVFQQGTLRILLPYKVPFNKEMDKSCKTNIYDKEMEVDQYTEEIDIRSSKLDSPPIVFAEDDA